MSNCHCPMQEWGQGKLVAPATQPKLVDQASTTNCSTSIQHSAHATGPPSTSPFYAITESGCTRYFSNITLICNKCPMSDPIAIHTHPTMWCIQLIKQKLTYPGSLLLPATATLCPPSHTAISHLCDAGCNVAFTANMLTSLHNNTTILRASAPPLPNFEIIHFDCHHTMLLMQLWAPPLSEVLSHLPTWHFSAWLSQHSKKHFTLVIFLNLPASSSNVSTDTHHHPSPCSKDVQLSSFCGSSGLVTYKLHVK